MKFVCLLKKICSAFTRKVDVNKRSVTTHFTTCNTGLKFGKFYEHLCLFFYFSFLLLTTSWSGHKLIFPIFECLNVLENFSLRFSYIKN